MEILNTRLGWAQEQRGDRTLLVILDVNLPEAPLPHKTAFVLFDRNTGALREPTYFRSKGLESGAVEKLDIVADVVSKTENAARKFAQRYQDDTGPGIPN